MLAVVMPTQNTQTHFPREFNIKELFGDIMELFATLLIAWVQFK